MTRTNCDTSDNIYRERTEIPVIIYIENFNKTGVIILIGNVIMCWTYDWSKISSEFVDSDNITRWDQKKNVQITDTWVWRRVWRYQTGNQNPYIEEEQTTQCCPVFRRAITDFHFELAFLIENKTNAKYWSRLNKYFLLSSKSLEFGTMKLSAIW